MTVFLLIWSVVYLFLPTYLAEDIGWRGINLPSYPDLSEEQIKYICDRLKKIVFP
ncbi:hypothetical protein [[Phormidium] sp. ETS-05]|uniref:hypothetical protein n=1 Tax=[Phormidium] sp. ETS-05 TaxID=222819 RepID=UPI0018EF2B48|nr:hypothetical protein [[Phormidium] sp. ETS-05]